jgi:hypothetical protein
MAFEGLRKLFKAKLVGVGEERIAVRTQGCWGCIHGGEEGYERAAKLWWDKARADTLARGAGIAVESPLGENDERVKSIRRNVPLTDVQIGQKQWISCKVGKNPDGTPVADFVASTFLCGQWSGASGASIAREGKGPDKLPQELMERFEDDGKLE